MYKEYRVDCWGYSFAVRADWAQADSQVEHHTPRGWESFQGRQVADFKHDGYIALKHVLIYAYECGFNCESEDIDEIMENVLVLAC